MSEFEPRTGAPEDPPEAQRPAAEEGFSTLERKAEAEARDDRMAAAWEAASMKRELNRQRERHRERRSATIRFALTGWFVVLFMSVIVYDALLWASFKKELWTDVSASARVTVETLCQTLTTGIRFGKRIDNYRGMDELLQDTAQASGFAIALMEAGGRKLREAGETPYEMLKLATLVEYDGNIAIREDEMGRAVMAAVMTPQNQRVGWVGAWIPAEPLEASLMDSFWGQVRVQMLSGLVGTIILLAVLLRLTRADLDQLREAARRSLTAGIHPESPARTERVLPRSARKATVLIFLLVMIVNGVSALQTVSNRYTEGLLSDAEKTGAILSGNLTRLMRVGLTLSSMDAVDAYLANVAKVHSGAVTLEIVDGTGKRLAGSKPPETKVLDEDRRFALTQETRSPTAASLAVKVGAASKDAYEKEAKAKLMGPHPKEDASALTLKVSLAEAPWMEKMRSTVLDVVTMVGVSLIFMVEIFLFFTRSSAIRRPTPGTPKSALLRPLTFFMMFSIDAAVSFIPLAMARLVDVGTTNRDLLLALPVSTEMAATGVAVLFAGPIVKRIGGRAPMMLGIALVACGYLGSMLAAAPWQFIAARAVVGIGYGTAILTAQAVSVKDNLLADMWAGVYAGSLCGSAVGAMLAEHFGFGVVFVLSAMILLMLVPTARVLMAGRDGLDGPAETFRDIHESDAGEWRPKREEKKTEKKLTTRELLMLLSDRRFLAFTIAAILPFSVLCVGFLNYFLPVFLDSAGTSQSDIGRIFMINCLLVVYTGPLFTKLIENRSKSFWTMITGVLAGASVLVLAVLPPLPGALAGSVLLGLATGLQIPAHSEYLLELPVARAIGVEQTMSLLDVLQRIGQVAGPILTGMVLAAFTVDKAALAIGAGFVLISWLFLFWERPAKKARTAKHAAAS